MSAAKEGDGGACYFLSRCFSGSCYSWEYHPFEEKEEKASSAVQRIDSGKLLFSVSVKGDAGKGEYGWDDSISRIYLSSVI